METTNQPGDSTPKQKSSTTETGKNGATNPKKPNNDPDQTPDREVENLPKAKPGKTGSSGSSKIGFKK